jgi:hypothetical protein
MKSPQGKLSCPFVCLFVCRLGIVTHGCSKNKYIPVHTDELALYEFYRVSAPLGADAQKGWTSDMITTNYKFMINPKSCLNYFIPTSTHLAHSATYRNVKLDGGSCSTPSTKENRHGVVVVCEAHGRMARGGHGLPKVSPRPAMPYPSTPCG